jgi:hypothetical protein
MENKKQIKRITNPYLVSGKMALLLTLLLCGCEKEAEWNIHATKQPVIVVEAMLTNEYKIQELRLSHPVEKMNDIPEPVTGAIVSVSWRQETVGFAESDETPGTYFSEYAFAAAVETQYELSIEYEDMKFEAETFMVAVLPYNLPVFNYRPQKGLYEINWNNSQYSPQEQAVYEARIGWTHLPSYNHPDSLSSARLNYYTLSTIDIGYVIFPQDKEEVLFPAGSIAIISKFAVNNDYGAYLRAFLAETQWRGNLFESAPGNLPGNISNGGLGYFSACAVMRDTLVVQ